ncbi:molybdate ABC transporter substrate-binding protein [Brevibacillus sp. SYSU BS000544]|uniref:molybdate ABC transporter substrate-binding protein n=1 Tax=Brevibacillus sp. SYSU BS000544 TaxID=3416443 RepID=UPI003CE53C4A
MFKHVKSYLFLFMLSLSLIAAQFSPAFVKQAEAAGAISLKVDGKALSVSQPPVIKEGRTLVPMRDIFEALGATVEWNGSQKTVIAKQAATTIQLQIGSKTAKINSKSVTLEVAAQTVNNKTMVPLRFISEALGANVIWNGHANSVAIVTPKLMGQKANLTIAAAASLTDAMNELKTGFSEEYPNYNLTFTFGSSGKLLTQIQQGAPVDVFLSASQKEMDTLQSTSSLVPNTRVNFAGNQLVLIAPKDSKLPLTSFDKIDVASLKQIAFGNPESVPAGRYAKETFESVKLWDKLQGKIVYGSDVRQVLTYVESGNVDLGVVFTSDALSTDKVKILGIANEKWQTNHLSRCCAFRFQATSTSGCIP